MNFKSQTKIARIQSGRALPHSKTSRRDVDPGNVRQRLGVRQCYAAFDNGRFAVYES
jgi:hypothetical protein